jgi:hypothetical protein
LKWKWIKGDVTNINDYGNPVSGTTSYTLCVYDRTAGTPSVVTSAVIPPGGTCGTTACWRSTGTTGFKYLDRNLARQGIKLIRLKPGTIPGRAKVLVLGKGVPLGFAGLEPLLPFDQGPTVTVQLVNSNGKCWSADYSAPPIFNQSDKFLDKGD